MHDVCLPTIDLFKEVIGRLQYPRPLCKVMEHMVATNFTQHLNKNNILYELQHDYHEKHSCKTQLIQLTEDLRRQLKEGQQVDLVLLDFS